MIHELKIESQYLLNVLNGTKKAEIRFDDRKFQVGDSLVFTVHSSKFTFKKAIFNITHIHRGLGLQKGYVMLSIERKI